MSTMVYVIIAITIIVYYKSRSKKRKNAAKNQQYSLKSIKQAQDSKQQPEQHAFSSVSRQNQESAETKKQYTRKFRDKVSSEADDLYSDDAFVGKFGESPRCNGFKCDPEQQCNICERRFCGEVMLKWNPNFGKDWQGQYSIRILNKWHRIDFAVAIQPYKKENELTTKALAIEFDGFDYHAQLKKKDFQKQLRRQNELYMRGWGILRFSYDDLISHANDCRNMINGAVKSQNSISSAVFSLPLFFADVFTPHDANNNASRWLKGVRGKPYIPVYKITDLSAFATYNIWAPCPSHRCPGRVFRNDTAGRSNWTCDTCNKAFQGNGEFPPEREHI